MFRSTHLTLGLLVLSTLITLSGCGPAEEPAPSAGPEAAPTSPEPAAPAPEPSPTPEPAASTTPEPATAHESAPETAEAAPAVEEKLPEVLAVRTAQFRGIMEKTIGKVTVLNFWATWCVPCVKEMPELVKFYNETSRDEVNFVSLSIDGEAEMEVAIPNFQRTHKMPFPIYILSDRNDDELFRAIRGPFLGGIPATFVYDQKGERVKMFEGEVTQAELLEAVAPLLEKSTP